MAEFKPDKQALKFVLGKNPQLKQSAALKDYTALAKKLLTHSTPDQIIDELVSEIKKIDSKTNQKNKLAVLKNVNTLLEQLFRADYRKRKFSNKILEKWKSAITALSNLSEEEKKLLTSGGEKAFDRRAQMEFMRQLILENNPKTQQPYSLEEYRAIANNLVTIATPNNIVDDLVEILKRGQLDKAQANKEAAFKQANMLLEQIMQADYWQQKFSQEWLKNNATPAMASLPSAATKQKKVLASNLQKTFMDLQTNLVARNEAISTLQQSQKQPGVFNLGAFVKQALARKVVPQKEVEQAAAKLASDLKTTAVMHLLNLKPTDFHHMAFEKKKEDTNLYQLINEFNQVSAMVKNDIFNAATANHMINVVHFYCQTVEKCIDNRDYHHAMAIYGALQGVAVNRLIKDEIAQWPELAAMMKKNEELFSPLAGQKNLQQAIAQDLAAPDQNAVIIPLMSFYLAKLVYFNEQPNYDSNGKINPIKMEGQGRVLENIAMFSQRAADNAPTNIKPLQTNVFERMDLVASITDDEEYAMSLKFRGRPLIIEEIASVQDIAKAIQNCFTEKTLFFELKKPNKSYYQQEAYHQLILEIKKALKKATVAERDVLIEKVELLRQHTKKIGFEKISERFAEIESTAKSKEKEEKAKKMETPLEYSKTKALSLLTSFIEYQKSKQTKKSAEPNKSPSVDLRPKKGSGRRT